MAFISSSLFILLFCCNSVAKEKRKKRRKWEQVGRASNGRLYFPKLVLSCSTDLLQGPRGGSGLHHPRSCISVGMEQALDCHQASSQGMVVREAALPTAACWGWVMCCFFGVVIQLLSSPGRVLCRQHPFTSLDAFKIGGTWHRAGWQTKPMCCVAFKHFIEYQLYSTK